jgi:hypothetical protein
VWSVKIQCVLSDLAVLGGSSTFILIYGFSLLTQLMKVSLRPTKLLEIVI